MEIQVIVFTFSEEPLSLEGGVLRSIGSPAEELVLSRPRQSIIGRGFHAGFY